MIRRAIFWVHFCAGVAAAVAILIMSVTGVLLAFERQLLEFADRGLHTVNVPAGAQPRPLAEMLATVTASVHTAPGAITVSHDAASSVQFIIGRDRVIYVDPYSGAVLGEGSQTARQFFSAITRWHRTLGESMAARGPLRAYAAASNLVFFLLAVTGCYLWLPRVWSWAAVRAAALFRGGLKGRSRDWNWHNVAGVWCAVPLLFITLTGVVISYPWANTLLFRLSGSTPPTRQGPPGSERSSRAPDEMRPAQPAADLDRAIQIAAAGQPGWRTLSLRVPAGAEAKVSLTADTSAGGEVEKKTQIVIDSRQGRIVHLTRFGDNSLGQRLRSLVRFTHTGEEFGIVGQIIAALASAGAVLLVWTGLALAYRRLFASRILAAKV
jgi:uncharacterized iron-regulated membrane protein